MKKITIVLVVLICFTIFCGCGAEGKHNLTTIEKFMNNYVSHNVDEDYYKIHDLDYYYLYDVTLDDANITKNYKGENEYEFPLFTSIYGRTAEMVICTDKKNYITSVEVNLKASITNLFESFEELIEYYATIITCAKPELSYDEARDIVEDLFEQENQSVSVESTYFYYAVIGDSEIRFAIMDMQSM